MNTSQKKVKSYSLLLLLFILFNNCYSQIIYKDGTELVSLSFDSWYENIAGVTLRIPNKGTYIGVIDLIKDREHYEEVVAIGDLRLDRRQYLYSRNDIEKLDTFNLPLIYGSFINEEGELDILIYGKTLKEWKNINKTSPSGQWKLEYKGGKFKQTLSFSLAGTSIYKKTESDRGYAPQVGGDSYNRHSHSWNRSLTGGYYFDVICDINGSFSWSYKNDTLNIKYLSPTISSKVIPDVSCNNCEPTYAKQWANQVRRDYSTNSDVLLWKKKFYSSVVKENDQIQIEKYAVYVLTDDLLIMEDVANGIIYEYSKNKVNKYALHNRREIYNKFYEKELEKSMEISYQSTLKTIRAKHQEYRDLFKIEFYPNGIPYGKLKKRSESYNSIIQEFNLINNHFKTQYRNVYNKSEHLDDLLKIQDFYNEFELYCSILDTLNYNKELFREYSKKRCPDVYDTYNKYYSTIEKTCKSYAEWPDYFDSIKKELLRQRNCLNFIKMRIKIIENHNNIILLIKKAPYIKHIYEEYYKTFDKSWTLNETGKKLLPILNVQERIINADWGDIKNINKSAKRSEMNDITEILDYFFQNTKKD